MHPVAVTPSTSAVVVTPQTRFAPWLLAQMVISGTLALAAIVAGPLVVTERSAQGTGLVVAHEQGRQVMSVVDGPRPGRHVVTWAEDIPVGQPFTVGLGGDCGCEPQPAVLVTHERPFMPATVIGLVVLALVGRQLAVGRRLIRRGRAAQADARSAVGTGPAPVVHLVPVWTTEQVPFQVELWPVEGGPPLGRVALGSVDRGFDPTVPFVAWGGPDARGAVALGSVDGRQLALPASPLFDRSAAPTTDPAVTAAVARIFGWPSTAGPGRPGGVAVIDAAVDEFRRRARTTTPLALGLSGLGWTSIIVALAVGPNRLVGVLAGGGLIAAAAGASVWARAPIVPLVEAVVGTDRATRKKVLGAVSSLRWTPAAPAAAHGGGAAADGSGWTPPPPRRP